MPLSFKPFSQIEFEDLKRLKSNAVSEGQRIDYKRDPYAPADNREFLKDFSSFANAQGGYLLIGIDEKNSIPTAINGVPNSIVDSEIQRLENLMRDGVEPRVVGTHIRSIRVDESHSVIAVQIPRSLNPPHRVTSQGLNKFYLRNSNGKHEASVEELRHLFGFRARLMDDIQSFVRVRRGQITSNNDFVPDQGNGRLIIHVVNASTFKDSSFIDVGLLFPDPYRLAPFHPSNLSKRMTLEGVVVGPELEGKFHNRTLIFRDGSIEAVYSGINHKRDGQVLLYGRHLVECILHSVASSMKEVVAFGGTGPFIINIAIETLKGAKIAFCPDPFERYPEFDRNVVELPPLTLLEFNPSISVPVAIRPLLDYLWNAVGSQACEYFRGDEYQPPTY